MAAAVAPPIAALTFPPSPSTSSPSRTATPASYADLRFPLPPATEKRYVGLLACQRDPLLRELETSVASCRKVEAAPPAKGKKGAKAEPVKDEWEVELLDTPLFPEGGGQPSDAGFLVPLHGGEQVKVRQVVRRNLDAVHYVDRPLEAGTKVRAVVEWAGREDRMAQHSGQHLLSAVLEQPPFNIPTLSWSLTTAPELCYVELLSCPSAEQIAAVQARVNDLIAEGRSVNVRFEYAGEGGVELGEKVPDNYKEDESGGGRRPVNRTVIIDGLDENPCCGTHAPSLSFLRLCFISPYTSPIRGTNTRLYFAFGTRALSFLTSSFTQGRAAAAAAGCALPDLADKTAQLVATAAEGKKKEKRLREELAAYVAKDVLDQARSAGGEGGVLAKAFLREEDATNSLEFLSLLSSELATLAPPAETAKQLFLLACGPSASSSFAAASSPATGAVIITGTADLVAEAGKRVVEALGKERIKGGGKGRWQGKVTGRWEKGDGLLLEKIVRQVAPA
ncbi:hypothetical protein JCM10213_006530 [Rhodosporidiobolus nylandii]